MTGYEIAVFVLTLLSFTAAIAIKRSNHDSTESYDSADSINATNKRQTDNGESFNNACTTDYIGYFQDGILNDVYPRNTSISLYEDRDVAYKATIIFINGKRYSLRNPKDIQAIPIPPYNIKDTDNSITLTLGYILRMCASHLRNIGEHELSILLLKKAHEIMLNTACSYPQKDYLQLPEWLYEDGRFEEGDSERDAILKDYKYSRDTDLTAIGINKLNNIMAEHNLIMFEQCNYPLYCEECAKYGGRIYRTPRAGKKYSKYPLIPEQYMKCGFHHDGCHTAIFPAYEFTKEIQVHGEYIPIDEAMRRPYTDNRTEEDKIKYEINLKEIQRVHSEPHTRLKSKREYFILKHFLSDNNVPKSYSAYMRAKNANNQSYINLINLAKQAGIAKDVGGGIVIDLPNAHV